MSILKRRNVSLNKDKFLSELNSTLKEMYSENNIFKSISIVDTSRFTDALYKVTMSNLGKGVGVPILPTKMKVIRMVRKGQKEHMGREPLTGKQILIHETEDR